MQRPRTFDEAVEWAQDLTLAEKEIQAKTLRARRNELTAMIEPPQPPPTETDLARLRQRIQTAITTGAPSELKCLLEGLIYNIKAQGQHHIQPTFRIPQGAPEGGENESVRALYGSAALPGVEHRYTS